MATLKDYHLYNEGDALYADMLAAIAKAEKSIFLETYLFAENIGWRFAKALAEKAKQGVTVRIVIDAAGALLYRSGKIIRFMRQHHIKVHLFHRWSWRQPMRYNKRNHRKMLLIDRTLVFLGGFNIHDASSREFYGEERWLDYHCRFTGILSRRAKLIFNEAWRGTDRAKGGYRVRKVLRLKEQHATLVPKHLRETYTALWPRGKQYIYLTTPYLVPDRKTQRALRYAAERGIDVRILVPQKNNHRIAAWAARAAYASLLNHGVRIFEYRPRMLHAKTFVMDDSWCSVGSANMDYRSFFLNYELNLFSRDTDMCLELKAVFMENCQQASEVLSVNWPNRPWSEKLTELIGWFARRWL